MEDSECTINWLTARKPSSHSITYVFVTAFGSISSSDKCITGPLYPESDHEATDPKNSLCQASHQNTKMQSDPTRLLLLISSPVPSATHVAVLRRLKTRPTNYLQPCIPIQQLVLFQRPSQSAKSVPSSRFLAQPLLKGIIGCTKTSGFTLCPRGGFQAILCWCKILPITLCSSVVGQTGPVRVDTRRDGDSVFFSVKFKSPLHSSPCAQPRPLVHSFHSERLIRHQLGCIIHHPHVIHCVLQQHVRKVLLASGNLVVGLSCWGSCCPWMQETV